MIARHRCSLTVLGTGPGLAARARRALLHRRGQPAGRRARGPDARLPVRPVRLSPAAPGGSGGGRGAGPGHPVPARRPGAGRRRWPPSWGSARPVRGQGPGPDDRRHRTRSSASAVPSASRSARPTPSSGAAKQIHAVFAEACTGCGKCVEVCPTEGIEMRAGAGDPADLVLAQPGPGGVSTGGPIDMKLFKHPRRCAPGRPQGALGRPADRASCRCRPGCTSRCSSTSAPRPQPAVRRRRAGAQGATDRRQPGRDLGPGARARPPGGSCGIGELPGPSRLRPLGAHHHPASPTARTAGRRPRRRRRSLRPGARGDRARGSPPPASSAWAAPPSPRRSSSSCTSATSSIP